MSNNSEFLFISNIRPLVLTAMITSSRCRKCRAHNLDQILSVLFQILHLSPPHKNTNKKTVAVPRQLITGPKGSR